MLQFENLTDMYQQNISPLITTQSDGNGGVNITARTVLNAMKHGVIVTVTSSNPQDPDIDITMDVFVSYLRDQGGFYTFMTLGGYYLKASNLDDYLHT